MRRYRNPLLHALAVAAAAFRAKQPRFDGLADAIRAWRRVGYVKQGHIGRPGSEPHVRGERRAERRRVGKALVKARDARSDLGRAIAARALELARRRHVLRPLGRIATAA
jgi:hypothetical protein